MQGQGRILIFRAAAHVTDSPHVISAAKEQNSTGVSRLQTRLSTEGRGTCGPPPHPPLSRAPACRGWRRSAAGRTCPWGRPAHRPAPAARSGPSGWSHAGGLGSCRRPSALCTGETLTGQTLSPARSPCRPGWGGRDKPPAPLGSVGGEGQGGHGVQPGRQAHRRAPDMRHKGHLGVEGSAGSPRMWRRGRRS
jgi:hypothetical protein